GAAQKGREGRTGGLLKRVVLDTRLRNSKGQRGHRATDNNRVRAERLERLLLLRELFARRARLASRLGYLLHPVDVALDLGRDRNLRCALGHFRYPRMSGKPDT